MSALPTARSSAGALAELLGMLPPTDEQAAVIEAPPVPALVVAGAGSGKTETMSRRVLWLVANGLAAPDEVLGLTFTRKAARELAERLDGRLRLLVDKGLLDEETWRTRKPVVQTYNAYASALFREFGLLIGRDPDSSLLGDPAAWLLALDVARRSDDARLAQIDRAERVATHLVRLAGELGDHRVSTDALRASTVARRFPEIAGLPDEPGRGKSATKSQRGLIEQDVRRVSALAPLADLVDAFDEEKRRLGLVQFSDQVRLALDALEAHPAAIADLRERHRYVLLDEFQDTSVLQMRLLGTLFRDHPVMAVGDPNQAIYGFRGASAGTLARFGSEFGEPIVLALSTSWRNDARILDVADAVASALPQPRAAATRVPVQRLAPRPDAEPGTVTVHHAETVEAEAEALATWFREHGAGTEHVAAAVLVRTHAQGEAFASALRERGFPVSRSASGALLEQPEVADLVAALRVLGRPEEGSSLVRLLAGSRWRIGVADLRALRHHASLLATRGLSEAQRDADRASVVAESDASIVDALDALVDGDVPAGLSIEGEARLREAGTVFRGLRAKAGLSLPELLRAVERALRLDIETASNPARHGVGALDAFAQDVHGFASDDPAGSLEGLLRYLDAVEEGRGLEAPQQEPAKGAVQVVTMHAAKGLEWDVVALPGLVVPGSTQGVSGWLEWGALPHALRGDAEMLESFDWGSATTLREYAEARADYLDRLRRERDAEDGRLDYVAVTRARSALWLSGAQWYDSRRTSSKPARLLEQAAEAVGVELRPAPPRGTENPLASHAPRFVWPPDPLGGRRDAVERAAALVRRADPADAGAWASTIELLLAAEAPPELALPNRIAASGFKDWAADPVAVAESIARPMPQRPYRATRLGTLFHEWVERRSPSIGLGDVVDAPGLEAEERIGDDAVGIDAERLERLQRTFLASPYGARQPTETEIEIHLPLAGTTVVCKIDAVYRDGDRATVVDWKTGRPPRDDADLEAKQLQLALYRAAYAAHAGLDPARVDAELYFVEVDEVVRPHRIESLEELEARWRAAQQAVATASVARGAA